MSLIRSLKSRLLLMTVLASIGFAGFLAPSAAQAAAPDDDVKRDSTECDKPENNKVNYSWAHGIATVTVYYNNHCAHDAKATLKIKDTSNNTYKDRCLTTKAGEKGKKKFRLEAALLLEDIKKGC